MQKINDIVLTWDTLIAVMATSVAFCYVPRDISPATCVAIYGTAISVLSILFSIFFASLAVIISFPDNSFIALIEKAGQYFSKLVSYYKLTLFILFGALLYTLTVYIYISLNSEQNSSIKVTFVIFIFLFTYSLVATISAVIVILGLTQSRATYLANKESERTEDDVEDEN